MAAGMGSRYGGLKQMEPMGPQGAALIDYSVYDALRSGFGKVVFIIRRDIEADFKKIVGRKWEGRIPVRYVFQELGMVPEGFRAPPGRTKPWGTGHAIWTAQKAVQEPFAVINADDYYGRDSFRAMAGFLGKLKKPDLPDYAMVGFALKNTLSEHGHVSRGVCETDRRKFLKKAVERTHIGKAGSRVFYLDPSGKKHALKGTETVSMNLWGFTPHLFRQLGEKWEAFLKDRGGEEKSEFLIPRVVDELIREKKARVKVLSGRSRWFGITYPDDKAKVREEIQKLVDRKEYPEKLWE